MKIGIVALRTAAVPLLMWVWAQAISSNGVIDVTKARATRAATRLRFRFRLCLESSTTAAKNEAAEKGPKHDNLQRRNLAQ